MDKKYDNYNKITQKEVQQLYIISKREVVQLKNKINQFNHSYNVLKNFIDQYYPNEKPSDNEDIKSNFEIQTEEALLQISNKTWDVIPGQELTYKLKLGKEN